MLNHKGYVQIISPDGRRLLVRLPDRGIESAAQVIAPTLRSFGLKQSPKFPWKLVARGRSRGSLPQFLLVRAVQAAAGFDPRQVRLETEWKKLQKLNEESDFVKVTPLQDGNAPEKYSVQFYCTGIVGIQGNQKPVTDTDHKVQMKCDSDFPTEPPKLKWLTPIWHPNIEHAGSKSVCVNKAEWLGGMGLDDLCRQLFEMVQYKNYHAAETPPYPLDSKVAAWVLDFAEPNGIVDKTRGISIDDRPFTRPTAATKISLVKTDGQNGKPKKSRIRVAASTPQRVRMMDQPDKTESQESDPPQTRRIRIAGIDE